MIGPTARLTAPARIVRPAPSPSRPKIVALTMSERRLTPLNDAGLRSG